jgi:hypothetical protein
MLWVTKVGNEAEGLCHPRAEPKDPSIEEYPPIRISGLALDDLQGTSRYTLGRKDE